MKHFIRLSDYKANDIFDIFQIADEVKQGKYKDALKGKTVVMFFPETSIRTRISFEKGIHLLGGQPILFPPETLDKKEDLKDVAGYLNNWADIVIIRHKDIGVMDNLAKYLAVPLVNAMTSQNHPCEIATDMYALSKIRNDFTKDNYLFCGVNGNIGRTWKEASEIMGFSLEQCCPKGYEVDGIPTYQEIEKAIVGKDVVCTDALQEAVVKDFKPCQVTKAAMDMANEGALLNPCPPFYRGEEVSADVIDSKYFVGYEFKKSLLEVQQAIMLWCLR